MPRICNNISETAEFLFSLLPCFSLLNVRGWPDSAASHWSHARVNLLNFSCRKWKWSAATQFQNQVLNLNWPHQHREMIAPTVMEKGAMLTAPDCARHWRPLGMHSVTAIRCTAPGLDAEICQRSTTQEGLNRVKVC